MESYRNIPTIPKYALLQFLVLLIFTGLSFQFLNSQNGALFELILGCAFRVVENLHFGLCRFVGTLYYIAPNLHASFSRKIFFFFLSFFFFFFFLLLFFSFSSSSSSSNSFFFFLLLLFSFFSSFSSSFSSLFF